MFLQQISSIIHRSAFTEVLTIYLFILCHVLAIAWPTPLSVACHERSKALSDILNITALQTASKQRIKQDHGSACSSFPFAFLCLMSIRVHWCYTLAFHLLSNIQWDVLHVQMLKNNNRRAFKTRGVCSDSQRALFCSQRGIQVLLEGHQGISQSPRKNVQ